MLHNFLQLKFLWSVLRASCLTLEINEFRCHEVKIEESEKAASALPLSHNNWTTTSPHNPLYVLHKWY